MYSELGDGQTIISTITNSSVHYLGFTVGNEGSAAVEVTAVMVNTGSQPR